MLESARRHNFARFTKIFEKYEQYFHLPQPTDKADPCWFAYLLTVKDDAPFERQDIVNALESAKIQTRAYFAGNILYHPGYIDLATKYKDLATTFPNAHLATTNSFFLGTFAGITEEKVDYIERVVDAFMQRATIK